MEIQNRTLRRTVQVVGAVAAGGLTAIALYLIYTTMGVPSLRETLVMSGGMVAVAVAVIGAWEYWERSDVLKIPFKGQITRSAPAFDDRIGAESVVDELESVTEDDKVEGLLLEVSSPGGEVTPSADIYHAIDDFEGPSVAVVEDMCASGAYLAAAACDRIYAREDSTVGSIGVIASQVNASELADDLGVDYQGFTAGEFKDAGHPLKEPSEAEQDYIQGLIDGHYERFVQRVADSRPTLDADAVRDLEARVFAGEEALERGLIDEIGDEDDAKAWLHSQLEHGPADEDDLQITESSATGSSPFSPAASAQRVTYAFGRGLGTGLEATTEKLLSGRRFR